MSWTDNLGERLVNGLIAEAVETVTKQAIHVIIDREDDIETYIIPESKLDPEMHQRIVLYCSDDLFTLKLDDYISNQCKEFAVEKGNKIIGPYVISGVYYFRTY